MMYKDLANDRFDNISIGDVVQWAGFTLGGVIVGFFIWIWHYVYMSEVLGVVGIQVAFMYGLIDAVTGVLLGWCFMWLAYAIRKQKTVISSEGSVYYVPRQSVKESVIVMSVATAAAIIGMSFATWAVIRYIIIEQPYGDLAWIHELIFTLFFALNGLIFGSPVGALLVKRLRQQGYKV